MAAATKRPGKVDFNIAQIGFNDFFELFDPIDPISRNKLNINYLTLKVLVQTWFKRGSKPSC